MRVGREGKTEVQTAGFEAVTSIRKVQALPAVQETKLL